MQTKNAPETLEAELMPLFCKGLAGDSKSYALFLQKISPLLRGFIRKKIPHNEVEDVMQDILISIHKARQTFDGERPLLPWLFAIVKFRIHDALRKIYVQTEVQNNSEEEDQITNFLDMQAHQEYEAMQNSYASKSESENDLFEELLEKISERDRNILSMLYIEEYSIKETGGRLNMKESAVKVAAHRAIKKMKEWVKL